MIVLAQLPTPDGKELLAWLACAALSVFLLNQAITFWKDHLREKPTPSDTYQTLADAKEQAEDNATDHRLLHGRISGTNDRIDEVVQAFNDKLQDMPPRIIQLLRDTGVIRK